MAYEVEIASIIKGTENMNNVVEQIATLLSKVAATRETAFNPAIGIELDLTNGTWYKVYTQSGALELKIASGSIVGGCAIIDIVTDTNTITVTGATIDSKSDTASTTNTAIDRYTFWKGQPTTTNTTGVWYSITNPVA